MYQIDRFGGIDNILSLVPSSDYVTYVNSYCHLNVKQFQSGDILPCVLSYVTLKDVNCVMNTCHAWLKATRSKTFWVRLIREAKEKLKHIEHIALFDTFCFPGETLREQVEWIWKENWIRSKVIGKQKEHNIVRKTHEYDKQVSIAIKDGKIVRMAKFLKPRSEFWYFNQSAQWSDRRSNVSGKAIDRNVIYHTEDGAIFVGKATKDDNDNVLPHGDGKWTFSDGSILEGKGVAWMGEPRQPLKRGRVSH